VRRFEREAKVQARFNHPNIVHVYELPRPADDHFYLVMEYVDGESRRDHLARRGPLPVDEALRFLLDILAGPEWLAELLAQMLVHDLEERLADAEELAQQLREEQRKAAEGG